MQHSSNLDVIEGAVVELLESIEVIDNLHNVVGLDRHGALQPKQGDMQRMVMVTV